MKFSCKVDLQKNCSVLREIISIKCNRDVQSKINKMI